MNFPPASHRLAPFMPTRVEAHVGTHALAFVAAMVLGITCFTGTLQASDAATAPRTNAEKPATDEGKDGVKVTLTDSHLCCGGCVKGVSNAVKKATNAKGAKVVCDRKQGTITITAKDEAIAKNAVAAVAKAGFHGASNHKAIKMASAEDQGAKDTTVSNLKLSGLHLCCGKCVRMAKDALSKVDGVKTIDMKNKGTTAKLAGSFNAKAAVTALNKAGYHVKVETDEK